MGSSPGPDTTFSPSRRRTLALLLIPCALLLVSRVGRLFSSRRRGAGAPSPGHPARFYRLLPFLLLPALLAHPSPARARSVQQPVVAGSFYPARAGDLREMVKKYLREAGPPAVRGDLYALIAPHAGYVFSGPVAAFAYRELAGRSYDLVVLLSPSHSGSFNGVAFLDADAYATPLGEVPLDRKLAVSLAMIPWVKKDPGAFQREHALEVQFPFLQSSLEPGYRILPLVMGTSDPALASALADLLAAATRGRRVLFIASSDMSHYHDYEKAAAMDHRSLDMVKAGEREKLARELASGTCELCGEGPVLTVMHLADKMGIGRGVILHYANSGDTAGDRSRVVGYGAVAFANPPGGLGLSDKAELLRIARATLDSFVRTGKVPGLRPPPSLEKAGACFVTLKERGMLRGCIGQLQAAAPLWRTVADMAVSSASRDSRFPPVKPEELSRIQVEISVLAPMTPVGDTKEIVLGRDGLLLSSRGRSGVFLPQVPLEQGWDLPTYLAELCGKAGLPRGAWKEEGARLFRFQAEVFRE